MYFVFQILLNYGFNGELILNLYRYYILNDFKQLIFLLLIE